MAGARFDGSKSGLMLSGDYGSSFSMVLDKIGSSTNTGNGALPSIYFSSGSPNLWVSGNYSGGFLKVSRDLGFSWSTLLNSGPGLLALSSDGGMAAYAVGTSMRVSSNGGGRWVARDISRSWTAVACSDDGRRLLAGASSDYIYYSDGTVMSRESGETASFIYTGSGVWMPLTSR